MMDWEGVMDWAKQQCSRLVMQGAPSEKLIEVAQVYKMAKAMLLHQETS